jgi:bifunctional aspartokinase / homoserine dehydrogenase 1
MQKSLAQIKKVAKFGGTSVATSQNIKKVLGIIKQQKENLAVVVSAFGNLENEPKITDLLIQTAQIAVKKDLDYLKKLQIFEQKHFLISKELDLKSEQLEEIKLIIKELEDLLKGIFLLQELSDKSLDFVMSFGERLSAQIISFYITNQGIETEFLDARKLIKTDSNFGKAKVDFEQTNKSIQNFFEIAQKLQIVTGFIASNKLGQTTTLGRGGSDYTAAIFGAALDVSEIQIWTDVSGVLTTDPRKVKNAFSLDYLTYQEAMEVSHFGAKVIYPPTIEPAKQKNIPVVIKNTFRPKDNGTQILSKQSSSFNSKNNLEDLQNQTEISTKNHKMLIKVVTSLDKIALIKIQGSGLKGTQGFSARLFLALAKQKINIILITQASSEYSICFVIEEKMAKTAQEILDKEFFEELKNAEIEPILIQTKVTIIAIIGENMRHLPGVAGRIFSVLGRQKINIIAIAQGSSELNISTVIEEKDEQKALESLHKEFFEIN